ncbi:MAG: hypothetical protein IPH85_06400 [Ignavibacteria bacterium]|nr:hypothetical protein [Ignavibacteria bacterium]
MKTSLYFGKIDGGDETGFHDSVVSQFNSNRPPSFFLIRESIQNIIDARLDQSKPALCTIDLVNVQISSLEFIDQYLERFRICMEYNSGDVECVRFLNRAIDIGSGDHVSFLRISDRNTTGLDRHREQAFLKSVGRSEKKQGAGGSFGLGKGSLFASSLWRTIFVFSNSVDEEGNSRTIFCGKSRLVSHEYEGSVRQGNGTYGYDGQRSVHNDEDIPDVFKRNDRQRGTDVWIAAFDGSESESWHTPLVEATLKYFWLSIVRGIVEVTIGENTIDMNTIGSYMDSHYPESQLSRDSPRNHYSTYVLAQSGADNCYSITKSIGTLGDVRLSFRISPDDYSITSFHRGPGMQVYQRKRTYAMPYTAVFECVNDVGNELLRRCENPEHDAWSHENYRSESMLPNNIISPSKSEVKNILSKIREVISEQIAEYGGIRSDSRVNIEILNEILHVVTDTTTDSRVNSMDNGLGDSSKESGLEHVMKVTRVGGNSGPRERSSLVTSTDSVEARYDPDGSFYPIHKNGKRSPLKRANTRQDEQGDADSLSRRLAADVRVRHVQKSSVGGIMHGRFFVRTTVNCQCDVRIVAAGETEGREKDVVLRSARILDSEKELDVSKGIVCDVPLRVGVDTIVEFVAEVPYQMGFSFLVRRQRLQ